MRRNLAEAWLVSLVAIAWIGTWFYVFVFLPTSLLARSTVGSWWQLIYWPLGPTSSACWVSWLVSPALAVVVTVGTLQGLRYLKARGRLAFYLAVAVFVAAVLIVLAHTIFGIMAAATTALTVIVLQFRAITPDA